MDNHHAAVFGISGMGKTNYLETEIYKSIWSRDRAVVFIDPHGQNAGHLLDRIPRSDIKRTTYLNFADYHYPVGFNPLKFGAHHTLTGLRSIWQKDWGPRMNSILRHVLMLTEDNGGTLSDIPRLLNDPAQREIYLRKAQPYVRRWFNTTFREEYLGHRDRPFVSVFNKIEEITATGLDRFLCQKHPKFDFTEFLNKNGILIVNLNQAQGDDYAAIAGASVITTLRAALLLNPHPCDLYADEFPTYGTSLFASMLSEMRKFGLSITVALQFLGQIEDEKLLNSILANTANKVYFRLQPADAELLARPYRDDQSMTTIATRLQTLPKHEAYVDGIHHCPDLFDAPAGKYHDVVKTSRLAMARQSGCACPFGCRQARQHPLTAWA
jgi:hypothetical protein